LVLRLIFALLLPLRFNYQLPDYQFPIPLPSLRFLCFLCVEGLAFAFVLAFASAVTCPLPKARRGG
jgi:hypothetical protein